MLEHQVSAPTGPDELVLGSCSNSPGRVDLGPAQMALAVRARRDPARIGCPGGSTDDQAFSDAGLTTSIQSRNSATVPMRAIRS